MSDRNEAINSRDWSSATVDTSTEEAMAALTFRLPAALLERIFIDAEAQGVKPRVLVRQIVEKHYEQPSGDVRLIHLQQFRSELEKAVEQVVARTTEPTADQAA